MTNRLQKVIAQTLLVAGFLFGEAQATPSTQPVDIASQRQLFVDDFLIDSLTNTRLELHHPQPQELVMDCNQPWEGNMCDYFRIIKDGGKFRMWYLGAHIKFETDDPIADHPNRLCYAESTDGMTWTKPDLGQFEFQGSKHNNIFFETPWDHFTPFIDTRPGCPLESRYKAIGLSGKQLFAWQSPDGIHWAKKSDKPIMSIGRFDTQNIAFWDPNVQKYRAYIRDAHNDLRDIRMATSDDFVTFTTPQLLDITPSFPNEQHYTNCVGIYERAPQIYVGFPTRYVERDWSPSMKALPDLPLRELRAKTSKRYGTALTDCLFMSSRDGFHFNRWSDAFLTAGPERHGTWAYGDCYPAYGLIETESKLTGAPNEFSMYLAEGNWMRSVKLRRYTLRLDGFISAHAPLEGGELLTKPVKFAGKRLSLNFATSAGGQLRVEFTDAAGHPLPGYTFSDCDETFGDSVDRTITWNGKSDTSSLSGQTVRLRFQLHEADVYAFQFTN